MTIPWSLLAEAAPATRPSSSTAPWWADAMQNPIFMMLAVLALFYFFMIKSKRKTESQRQSMLNQLKRGDRIQTIGGVLGTVIEAREGDVLVKVDESSNTKIRFVRSAIHRVVEEEKPQAK